MKVIVASMPKCGTKTLHKCLEILGYSVADFDIHGFNYRDEWKEIMLNGGVKRQYHKMYEDIDAVCDLPAAYYWEELASAFPDAKIILTTKANETEWVQSYRKQIAMLESSWKNGLCLILTPTGRQLREHYLRMGRIVFSCPPQGLFHTTYQPNEEILKKRYREHNAAVISRSEPGKLLHFNLSEGWQPLCSFLNKDIPDCPFPHENMKGQLAESVWDLPGYKRMTNELYIVFVVMATIFCVAIQAMCLKF